MTTTSLMLVGSLLRITAANQATATRVTHVLRGTTPIRARPPTIPFSDDLIGERSRLRRLGQGFLMTIISDCPSHRRPWFGQG